MLNKLVIALCALMLITFVVSAADSNAVLHPQDQTVAMVTVHTVDPIVTALPQAFVETPKPATSIRVRSERVLVGPLQESYTTMCGAPPVRFPCPEDPCTKDGTCK